MFPARPPARMSLAVFSYALLGFGASATLADEGRIPIFEPTTLDGAQTDIGGKYIVTRNIAIGGNPGDPTVALTIVGTGTEVLDIDLNGFAIAGHPFDPEPTIEIDNVRSVTLRGGTVRSSLTTNCIEVTAKQVVIDGLVLLCGVQAISITSADTIGIRDNRIRAEGGSLSVSGVAVVKGQIERNLIESGGMMGGPDAISVTAPSSGLVVRENQIDGAGSAGIELMKADNALVVGNSVRSVGGAGIVLLESSGSRVNGNATRQNHGAGLFLSMSADCLVEDNVSSSNGGHGISLVGANRNHLEGNVTNRNGTGPLPSFGIFFSPTSNGNSYGRNSSRGNLAAPGTCANPGPATCGAPEFCDLGTGNGTFGDNLLPGQPPC